VQRALPEFFETSRTASASLRASRFYWGVVAVAVAVLVLVLGNVAYLGT